MCYVCANPHTLTIENICGEDFCPTHTVAFSRLEREWYTIRELYTNYSTYSKHKLANTLTVSDVIEICDYIRSTCAQA